MSSRMIQIAVFGLACVFAVRSGMVIWRAYKAGDRVTQAEEQLNQAKKENEALKQKLAEVSDPEFALLQARDKLGLGREDEVVLVFEDTKVESGELKVESFNPEANWKKWWDLYVRL